jgi:hypothetical protein
MFFEALSSASKMMPQLVQTKRERLIRLAASMVPQACGRWIVQNQSQRYKRLFRRLDNSPVRLVSEATRVKLRLILIGIAAVAVVGGSVALVYAWE